LAIKKRDHIGVTHVFWALKFNHSQENKYVDRRFSSINFGLPGSISSSRHDKDTPLGLIFAANPQKSRHPRFQNVPRAPARADLTCLGLRSFQQGQSCSVAESNTYVIQFQCLPTNLEGGLNSK
jgi:hypothetical protein